MGLDILGRTHLLHDNGCDQWRAWISSVTLSGDNSIVAVWRDPSSLCEGCGLWDY